MNSPLVRSSTARSIAARAVSAASRKASEAIRTQWKNEAYHTLMIQGRETIDQNKRAEIYKKAQQIYFDECSNIPIAHSTVIWPALKSVHNFKLHPTSSVRLKNVWLK